MGRTALTFRIAIEQQHTKWKSFRHVLRSPIRENFDWVFEAAMQYADAGTMTTQSSSMMITILLSAVMVLKQEVEELKSQIESL